MNNFNHRQMIPVSKLYRFSLTMLLLIIGNNLFAQKVNVTVNIVRPFQPNVADYRSRPQLITVTLNNLTQTEQNIQLAGSFSGDNNVSIATKPGYKGGQPVVLAAFQTKVLNANDLTNFFNFDQLIYQGITKEKLITNSTLPEGSYTLCVQALDYSTLTPLSNTATGCSAPVPINTLEAPTILQPVSEANNGANIGSQNASNVVGPKNSISNVRNVGFPVYFSWTTPPNSPANAYYKLKVVEMAANATNAAQALATDIGFHSYESTEYGHFASLNSYEYTFEIGKKYAVQVTAVDPSGNSLYRNNGVSEPVWFMYGSENEVAQDKAQKTEAKEKAIRDSLYVNSTFATKIIKGRFVFAFKKGEENNSTLQNVSNGNNSVFTTTNNADITKTLIDPTFKIPNSTKDNYNDYYNGDTKIFAGGSAVNTVVQAVNSDSKPGNSKYPLPGITFTVDVNNNTSETLNLKTQKEVDDFDATMQAKSDEQWQLLVDKAKKGLFQTAPQRPLVTRHKVGDVVALVTRSVGKTQTVSTDKNGEFTINLAGNNTVNSITINNDKFIPAFDNKQLLEQLNKRTDDATGALDVGEIVFVANTARIQPFVQEETSATVQGNIKNNFDVGIYRKKAIYYTLNKLGSASSSGNTLSYLDYEGDAKGTSEYINGANYIKIADIKNGETVGKIFPEGELLFKLTPTDNPAYVAAYHTLTFNNDLPIFNATTSVLCVKPVYKVNLGNPFIKGKVMLNGGNTLGSLPVAGATIKITAETTTISRVNNNVESKTTSQSFTTTTQADGSYIIGNLPLVMLNGSRYVVTLLTVPAEFKNLPIVQGKDQYQNTLGKGQYTDINFDISPNISLVSGKIIDSKGNPLANTTLQFATGDPFVTDDDGTFKRPFFDGNTKLTVSKFGYQTKQIDINVGSGEPIGSRISAIDAQKMGVSGYAFIQTNKKQNNIMLQELTGNVTFTVRANKQLLPNASVTLFDKTLITDANGTCNYQGIGGDNILVTVAPPTGSNFIATQFTMSIDDKTGQTGAQLVDLAAGIKISGKVTAKSIGLAGAKIVVDGKPYLNTATDNMGNYLFYVPSGTYNFAVTKQGYIGKTNSNIVANNSTPAVNFDLTDGGGKNINKLLGFDIELKSTASNADGSQNWTGNFINLKPIPAFVLANNYAIPFSNVKVRFDTDGNAMPEGDQVKTDITELPFKLFDFIPMKLVNLVNDANTQIIINRETDINHGTIKGLMQLNFDAINPIPGFKIDDMTKTYLSNDKVDAVIKMLPFISSKPNLIDQATSYAMNFLPKDIKVNADWHLNLYGFKLDVVLPSTSITADGISIKGNLKTPVLGILPSIDVAVKNITISSSLKISKIDCQSDLKDKPITLKIDTWSASVTSIGLNDDGFKIGGNINVTLPGSKPSNLKFNELKLAQNALFGGSFILPNDGIDVFNAVKFKTGNIPFTFGKLPNAVNGKDVYRLTGSGKIKFASLIKDSLEIPTFQIQTDGQFQVTTPANVSSDLGFAKFKIAAITFSNMAGNQYIGLKGEYGFDVGIVKINADEIKFSSTGADLGKISAAITIPGIDGNIDVKYSEEKGGIEGKGKLKLAKALDVDGDFHFYKNSSGIDLGATFAVTSPPIPVGTIVISKIGGGFSYSNQGGKDLASITLKGNADLSPNGAPVLLNNIVVKINSDLVIDGSTDVAIGTAGNSILNAASAKIHLDVPNTIFNIDINAEIEPIKGVAKATLNGMLELSGRRGDEHVFIGANINLNAFNGLIKSDGQYVMAYHLKNPKHRDDATDKYFTNAPQSYLGNEFSGVYFNSTTSMGVHKDKAWGFDIGVIKAKAWLYSDARASFIMNLAGPAPVFRLGMAGAFGGGAEAAIGPFGIGVDLNACFKVEGGRDNVRGWNFEGDAMGTASLKIGGCDPDCNEASVCIIGAGAKFCVGARLHLGLSEKQGLDTSFHLDGGSSNCDQLQ